MSLLKKDLFFPSLRTPPRLLHALILGVALSRCHAGEPSPPPAAPAAAEVAPSVTNAPSTPAAGAAKSTGIDRGHGRLSRWVVSFADVADSILFSTLTPGRNAVWTDLERFYGERRETAQSDASMVELSPGVRWSEGGKMERKTEFRARIDLPRTQERVQFIADSIDPEDRPVDPFEGRPRAVPGARGDDSIFGLRARLLRKTNVRVSLDGGVRLEPEPKTVGKLRGSISRDIAPYRLTLSEVVFWRDGEGFGEKTLVQLDRTFLEHWRASLTSSALWSETSEGVDLSSYVTVMHRLSNRRSAGIRAGVTGHTLPSAVVDKYYVRAPYRQRIYRDWLFFEVEPGIDLPDEDSYRINPLIILRLDILFGNMRSD